MRFVQFNRPLILLLAFQLTVGVGVPAWGQGTREQGATKGKGEAPRSKATGKVKPGPAGKGPGAGVVSSAPAEESMPGGQALSRAVVPDQYVLGPGDGLTISIWGEYDETYQLSVSPDGKISLPTIGELVVKELTLTQAGMLVDTEVKRYYRNVKTGLSLTSLRVFQVLVLGAVELPGTYLATPVRRVSDVIERAGGIQTGGTNRHVEVRRDGRVRAEADLFAFLQKGDESANPFLQDGDVIFVPPIGEHRVTVYVNEVVIAPGTGAMSDSLVPHSIELKKGERLSTVINEVGGVSPWWDLEGVFVERVSQVPAGTMRIPVNLRHYLVENDGSQNLEMEAGDQVYIPATIRRVFVAGAVRLPSGYTYLPGRTADAYIAQAGGMSLTADPEKSFIKRTDGTLEPYVGNVELNNGDTVVVLEKTFKTYTDYFALVGAIAGVVLTGVGMLAAFTSFRR